MTFFSQKGFVRLGLEPS